MEKLIYLLGDAEPGSIPRLRVDLRDALLEKGPALLSAGAQRLSFTVADLGDEHVDSIDQFNAHGLLDAKVSLWLDSLDDRAEVEALLSGVSKRLAGYLVTESVPKEYDDRDWPDGERSPGVALVTTFPKPDTIDDEAFYRCWHGSHTPLSLEIHPLLHYVRNVAARSLTPGAPPFRAIVNESVASAEIAATPELFYGSPDGQKRAVKDLIQFVDFKTLSTVVMSEYILSS